MLSRREAGHAIGVMTARGPAGSMGRSDPSEEIDRVSLLRRRSHDDEPPEAAVPAPPAAPAPAAPPSSDELESYLELRALKDQLEAGTLTQAEFDARRKQLGVQDMP
jgi:hypothetical protein